MADTFLDFIRRLLQRVRDALKGGPLTPERAAAERARLVAENPEWQEIFDFAQQHPEEMEAVLRYARYIVSGQPGEQAPPQPQG